MGAAPGDGRLARRTGPATHDHRTHREDHARMRPWRAYPTVFATCRDASADRVTYRRVPQVAPKHLPVQILTNAEHWLAH